MSKKQEQQNEIDRLRNDMGGLQARNAFLSREVARRNRALYAGTRRYMRQAADLVAAAGLTKVQRQVIERLRGQLEEERASWSRVADAQEQTVEHLREELRAATELQEPADLQHQVADAQADEVARVLRALDAGARRYQREQDRASSLNEQVIQRTDRRIALVEESAVQSALTALEAVQDAHQSRKLAAAATRRADKLAAKLMIRARETGKERLAYAHAIVGRERALEDANKRARGLQASLRKVKTELKAERRELERAWGQVRELRRKLRESNKSVLMGSLGGGLEVQPVSGRPFENTAGYSSAARRAAEGHQ